MSHRRRMLALDFDGVISNSLRETFVVGRRAYLDCEPSSSLGEDEGPDEYARFEELMPLGNRAEDFGTVFAIFETGAEVHDQPSYSAFRAQRGRDWLRRYHERFYEVRRELTERDPAAWRAMNRPYKPFVELLRRRAGELAYAIVTSKDRRSVDDLLADYGIADLFRGEHILDKEVGERKTAHFEQLHRITRLGYDQFLFVDDKVNHLDSVRGIGVHGVLATWGFNSPREHELARAHGHLVCTLENAEEQLWH